MHNYKVQHLNMFIGRNSCEVAILVYLKGGGLEKHHSRGDTAQ